MTALLLPSSHLSHQPFLVDRFRPPLSAAFMPEVPLGGRGRAIAVAGVPGFLDQVRAGSARWLLSWAVFGFPARGRPAGPVRVRLARAVWYPPAPGGRPPLRRPWWATPGGPPALAGRRADGGVGCLGPARLTG
jgi:hypothetical protein